MHYKITLMFSIFILLSGCGSTHKKSVERHAQPMPMPQVIVLDLDRLETVNVNLTSLGYDGDLLASSVQQAQMNAATAGGGSAAGGLAGALISVAIIQGAGQSALQKERNAPVQGFIDTLQTVDWLTTLQGSPLADAFTIMDKASYDAMIPAPQRAYMLTPTLNISANYLSLQLSWELEALSQLSPYRNYFELNTPDLFSLQQSLSVLNTFTEADVRHHLMPALSQVKKLIAYDFMQSMQPRQAARSIRFTRNNIKFYERGTVLSADNNELIYRNLRGELKLHPYDELL